MLHTLISTPSATREARLQALMEQLRPASEQALRKMAELSPATRPLVALAGALAPFKQAEDVLRRMAGLQLSASTCRRITEAADRASRRGCSPTI